MKYLFCCYINYYDVYSYKSRNGITISSNNKDFNTISIKQFQYNYKIENFKIFPLSNRSPLQC